MSSTTARSSRPPRSMKVTISIALHREELVSVTVWVATDVETGIASQGPSKLRAIAALVEALELAGSP